MAAPAEATAPTAAAGKKGKKATPKKTKPAAAKSKGEPAHPSYLQMSSEAIVALKERTGSSQYAIAKYIDSKYRGVLPANFKKLLSVQLRNLVKQNKLVKVKASYKLSDELKKQVVPKKGRTAATLPLVPKAAVPKKAAPKKVATPKKPAPKKAAPKKAAKPVKREAPKKIAAPATVAQAPSTPKKAVTPKKATKKTTPKRKATPAKPAAPKSPATKPVAKSPKPKAAAKSHKAKKAPAKRAKKA